MPAYKNQKKTKQYSLEFKRSAVEMSLEENVQVQDVAARVFKVLCQPIFTDPRKSIRPSKWMLSCCSVRFRFCTGYVY
jgi:hypothetical protein